MCGQLFNRYACVGNYSSWCYPIYPDSAFELCDPILILDTLKFGILLLEGQELDTPFSLKNGILDTRFQNRG